MTLGNDATIRIKCESMVIRGEMCCNDMGIMQFVRGLIKAERECLHWRIH